MLTHKKSKFLFYNFNSYLNRIGKPVQFVRHTIMSDNNYALTFLPEKFGHRKNTIGISEWIFTVRRFRYNTVGDNLLDYLHNCPAVELQKIDENMRINGLFSSTFKINIIAKKSLTHMITFLIYLIDFLVIWT